MANGHPAARRYPIGMVWVEVDIVRRRINHQMASESLLMQTMLASILNPKKGSKTYKEQINGLIG